MASSTTSDTTLLPQPTSVDVPHGHGMRLYWTGVALIVVLTAALGTWAITQSRNDPVVDSSTSAVSGQLSPRAVDHRDAQIIQLQVGTSTRGLSPSAVDYRDGQGLGSSNTTSGPVSPNTADYRDSQSLQRMREPQ